MRYGFTLAMAPLAAGLMLQLIAAVPLAFGSRRLMLADVGATAPTSPPLLWALPAYLRFVWLVEAGLSVPAAIGHPKAGNHDHHAECCLGSQRQRRFGD